MIQKRSAIIIFVAMLLVILVIPVTGFSGDSTMLSNPAILNPNIQKGSGGGVPVGTVITWPVGSNPEDAENWLECNGQSVSQTAYPELRAIMTRVPDYQGMFLRGYGSQSHAQNNGSAVGVTQTMHASGPLGQVQGDALRNISGGWHTPNGIMRTSGVMSVSGQAGNDRTMGGFNEWGSQKDASFDTSRVVPISPEIRPANMAVRYLIRAAR